MILWPSYMRSDSLSFCSFLVKQLVQTMSAATAATKPALAYSGFNQGTSGTLAWFAAASQGTPSCVYLANSVTDRLLLSLNVIEYWIYN